MMQSRQYPFQSLLAFLLLNPWTNVIDACQECTLSCDNEGQCVFQWRTASQKNDSFTRVMACHCTPGFTGPNCEKAVAADESSSEECNLDCQNGGKCVLNWMATLRFMNDPLSTSCVCDCPEGYAGLKCEHRTEICPDGKMCYNEAKCVADHVTDSKGLRRRTKYICDCAGAYEHSELARKLCEQSAIDYCNDGSSAYRNHFCVNGGKCRQTPAEVSNPSRSSCDCPEGFGGPHCEHTFSREALTTTATAETAGTTASPENIGPASPIAQWHSQKRIIKGLGMFLIVTICVVCVGCVSAVGIRLRRKLNQAGASAVEESDRKNGDPTARHESEACTV